MSLESRLSELSQEQLVDFLIKLSSKHDNLAKELLVMTAEVKFEQWVFLLRKDAYGDGRVAFLDQSTESRRLFVRQLSFDTTTESLMRVFATYGNLEECVVQLVLIPSL